MNKRKRYPFIYWWPSMWPYKLKQICYSNMNNWLFSWIKQFHSIIFAYLVYASSETFIKVYDIGLPCAKLWHVICSSQIPQEGQWELYHKSPTLFVLFLPALCLESTGVQVPGGHLNSRTDDCWVKREGEMCKLCKAYHQHQPAVLTNRACSPSRSQVVT